MTKRRNELNENLEFIQNLLQQVDYTEDSL